VDKTEEKLSFERLAVAVVIGLWSAALSGLGLAVISWFLGFHRFLGVPVLP